MGEQKKQILPWADACRLVAMFGVILIHTAAPVFYDFRHIPLGAFLTANMLDSLARVSVPLFAMLSGALLLGRDTSKVLRVGGHIARVAIPLIFWSFVYAFWVDYWTGKPFDAISTLNRMWQAPVMHHLWFVYMIIGIYLLLPILSVISSAMLTNRKLAFYFFGLWFVVNSLAIYYPINLITQFKISDFLGWPGYFILGHFLTHSEWSLRISAKVNTFVFFLASLSTFSLAWRFNVLSPTPNETAFEYFSPNVAIASSAAFLWLRQTPNLDFLAKPLAFFSSKTFPVYFMHVLILEIFQRGILGFSITSYFIHPMVGIMVLALATFFTSMSIAILLRAIPYSSRIIG